MVIELTIVGLDLEETVRTTVINFRERINRINQVKYGRIGNFRTLTYYIDVLEPDSMVTRRDILNELSQPGSPTVCMYEHGDSSKLYVFKKTAFKQDED